MSYIILARYRHNEPACGSFKTETKAECSIIQQELTIRGYCVDVIPPTPVDLPDFIVRKNRNGFFSFLI